MAICSNCGAKCWRSGVDLEIRCDYWVEKSCDTCKFKDKLVACEECAGWEPQDTTMPKINGTTEAAKHYQVSDMQPIEIMQSYMPKEQFLGLLRGNVIKYILQMGHKDDKLKEAEKACQYAEWLVKALKDEKIVPGGKK